MNTLQTNNLQEYIKLPLKVIAVGDKMFPDVIVTTPHKGDVQIKLKTTHYPFIFGSVTQTDKDVREVLKELFKIENESKDYLLNEWLNKK